jgi:hypothetical protein
MAGGVGVILFRRVCVICVVLCGAVFVLGGCFLRFPEKTVDLPQTSYLSDGYGWGVITDPYASFFDTPGSQGIIAAHGRRGEVLAIGARRIVNENNSVRVWFRFEQGWLPETAVQLFSNIYQARNAAGDML